MHANKVWYFHCTRTFPHVAAQIRRWLETADDCQTAWSSLTELMAACDSAFSWKANVASSAVRPERKVHRAYALRLLSREIMESPVTFAGEELCSQ